MEMASVAVRTWLSAAGLEMAAFGSLETFWSNAIMSAHRDKADISSTTS